MSGTAETSDLMQDDRLAVSQVEASALRSFRGMMTYFIQRDSGGPIKIGKTDSIDARLSSLQGGSVDTLVCVAYIEGDCEEELQERFHHLCKCGEWFNAEPELLAFIEANAIRCNIRRPPRDPESIKRAREKKAAGRVVIPGAFVKKMRFPK